MSARVKSRPLITVADVPASASWYCALLEGESGHGGDEYEQILVDGEMVLQLHAIETEDWHGALRDTNFPVGNGVLIWFAIKDFEAAVERIHQLGATVDIEPVENPLARQMEVWLRDPDGYRVVLAGPSAYDAPN